MSPPQRSSRQAAGPPGRPPRATRHLILVLTAVRSFLAGGAATGAQPPPPAAALLPVQRSVAQDQGAWVIDYRLRYTGPTAALVAPHDVAVKVKGWVSNSRVASHAVPRLSSLTIAHRPELTADCKVIAANDQEHSCREELICRLSVVRRPSPADADGGSSRVTKVSTTDDGRRTTDKRTGPLSLAPGDVVHVRLRLEHHHVIFGDYDPLLGVRTVEITLAGATVRDLVPLDHEHYLAQPKFSWPEPPEERRDTRHAISGPDSLHLAAHVPGHHYYRYPDRPVRYGTPMRLRFSYLVAAGTEGECRFRVAQYKDTPTSWRMLNGAGFEKCLKVVGRWTKVEHIFTTDAEATTLALDFRIAGVTDIGEMWIDDVRLEPVGCPGPTGP